MQGRLTRRLLGLLRVRVPEAGFHHVVDLRRQASTRWDLPTILGAVVTSMLAGCKGLREMEALTAEMSRASRRVLGIQRRLPDTTARQALVGVRLGDLREVLRRQVRTAHRRKALKPDGLPFGVVSLDGKFVPAPPTWRSGYVQIRNIGKPSEFGLIGTITATLISSSSKVCLDAEPIPRTWGEESRYPNLLGNLLRAYGKLDLFRLVTYDAGGCCRYNARLTREMGLHYLFRVKEGRQPKLFAEAQRRLASQTLDEAQASTEDRYRGQQVRRSVYLAEDIGAWPAYAGHRAVVRIRRDRLDDDGQVLDTDDRYYITSLSRDALTGEQWIQVTRGHWAVENNCHHTWDAVFREDDRPWIVAEPRATLAVMLLRRIAYNILTLYRSVTMRSAGSQMAAWRDLMRWIHNALIAATRRQVEGLRQRKLPLDSLA